MIAWPWFAALVVFFLVFDAWVFKRAKRIGYRQGYARGASDYAPPHVIAQWGDTSGCTECSFRFDTNDYPNSEDVPPCDRYNTVERALGEE